MPREVYDPKDPELEFYNSNRPRRESNYEPKPRRKNIFKSKIFIIGYGIFLIGTLAAISIYQKKSKEVTNNKSSIEIKVNNALLYTDSVKVIIELINKKYITDDDNIENLKAYMLLYSKENVIASNSDIYNNIMFKTNEHIGFSVIFSKENWNKADTMKVTISPDDTNTFKKNIKTRFVKLKTSDDSN